MNYIQDNTRFIDLIYGADNIRSICKDYVRVVETDEPERSLFLGMTDNAGISLNYYDFFTITAPTKIYPSLEAFYEDIFALLNNANAVFTFYPNLTQNELNQVDQTSLDYVFTGDKEGLLYYVLVPIGDIEPTVAEIIAGTSSGGGIPVASNTLSVTTGSITENIPGLTTLTGYDLYSVTTNTAGDEVPTNSIKLTQTTL
jgi:hypothetical protein